MKNKIIVMASCLFILLMVMFPGVTQQGTKTAIVIWSNSIIPVLLPFFIFSEFIKKTGDLNKLTPGVYPFVIAFLSGYPMGAKVVGDYIRSGDVTLNEGREILSYSLITGPAFIIFTVGSFIGNTKAAIVVAIAHYIGAFLNKRLYKSSEKNYRVHSLGVKNMDYMENFSLAIISGFRAMATILAYLMFFAIGINLVDCIGVFKFINNQVIISVLKGVLEMTLGISMLGMCNISLKFMVILATVLVSFGGLSVIGQSSYMLRNTGLNMKDVIEIKFTHALFAGIVATLLVNNVVI